MMLEGLGESTVRLTVPVLLVALGEVISQRAGVINIGLEGMMTAGAYVGYLVTLHTGDPLLAAAAAVAAGVGVAAIMAALAVWGEADQILVGFALFILFPGICGFFYEQASDSGGVTPLLPTHAVPLLSQIPIIGGPLFDENGFYWAAVVLSVCVWFLLTRTRFGLRVTASGQNPAVSQAKGVNVKLVRSLAVLLCGGFAGLGGAALTVGALGSFSTTVTGGRGFIAIAIVILGRWRVGSVVVAALAIGLADALRLRFSGGLAVPVQLLAMAPWLVMLVMLIAGARWAVAPAGLGENAGRTGRK